MLSCVQPCVTAQMNENLLAPFKDEEYRIAIFQMAPDKSPV